MTDPHYLAALLQSLGLDLNNLRNMPEISLSRPRPQPDHSFNLATVHAADTRSIHVLP